MKKVIEKMKLLFIFYFVNFMLCHVASYEIVEKELITLYPGNMKITELTDATLAQSVFNSPQEQIQKHLTSLCLFVEFNWLFFNSDTLATRMVKICFKIALRQGWPTFLTM